MIARIFQKPSLQKRREVFFEGICLNSIMMIGKKRSFVQNEMRNTERGGRVVKYWEFFLFFRLFSIKMTCQVLKHTVSDDVRLGSGENRRIYFCAHFFYFQKANFHTLSSYGTNAMRCHEYSRGLMRRHWSNPFVWCYSKALFK